MQEQVAPSRNDVEREINTDFNLESNFKVLAISPQQILFKSRYIIFPGLIGICLFKYLYTKIVVVFYNLFHCISIVK